MFVCVFDSGGWPELYSFACLLARIYKIKLWLVLRQYTTYSFASTANVAWPHLYSGAQCKIAIQCLFVWSGGWRMVWALLFCLLARIHKIKLWLASRQYTTYSFTSTANVAWPHFHSGAQWKLALQCLFVWFGGMVWALLFCLLACKDPQKKIVIVIATVYYLLTCKWFLQIKLVKQCEQYIFRISKLIDFE